MEKTETPFKNQQPDTTIDLSKAYILNGNTLELQTTPFDLDENQVAPIDKKFKSKKEFEEIILLNGKVLFGNDTLLINTQLKKDLDYIGTYTPDAILFNFKDQGKPKSYLIEAMYSKQDFYGHIAQRMSGFFKQNNDRDERTSFIELVCKMINKNYHFKKKIKSFIKEEDVPEFINRMLSNKPSVLLIMDGISPKVQETVHIFCQSWGKLVIQLVLQKFSINKELLCSMSPAFCGGYKTLLLPRLISRKGLFSRLCWFQLGSPKCSGEIVESYDSEFNFLRII